MPRKIVTLLSIVVVIVALDQWTKYLVVGSLTTRFDGLTTLSARLKAMYGTPPAASFDGLHFRYKRAVTVSEKFFRLRYTENPGAAWGLFRSLPKHIRGPMFHIVSLGAVLLIGFYYSKLTGKDPAEKWAYFGLPLVLGGALGNYVDRLARGFVIDYLEAHWYDKAYWPSFNVADSAICVGVGMLLLDAFMRREEPAKEAKPENSTASAKS